MAKISLTTTTTTEDPELERDRNLIKKFRSITKPIQSEMEEIFMIYKKYVDPNAAGFCGTCNGGPHNSIQRYWLKVISLDI